MNMDMMISLTIEISRFLIFLIVGLKVQNDYWYWFAT